MGRRTTPRALSPKRRSVSFRHTATGVFLLDSLGVELTDKFQSLFPDDYSWQFQSVQTYLLRTISMGTPGLTIAIFIHSLPRSTDITATESAGEEKMVSNQHTPEN